MRFTWSSDKIRLGFLPCDVDFLLRKMALGSPAGIDLAFAIQTIYGDTEPTGITKPTNGSN